MENLYQKFDALLQGRNRESKKWNNNTWLIRHDDRICLKLHDTNVVTMWPEGAITLDSGGWLTHTTKDRMNGILPQGYRIYQEKNIWHIGGQYLFEDGMRIEADGTIMAQLDGKEEQKKRKAWIKKVNDFAQEMVNRAFNGTMKAPSGGDCWYCLMKTQGGETLGDSFKDNDHIINHINEGYYVPSLFWNAMGEGKDWLSRIAKHNLGVIQQRQQTVSCEYSLTMEDLAKDQCYKMMRKYLRKRLGLSL